VLIDFDNQLVITLITFINQMKMNIKPIRTEKDYEEALALIDAILDAQPDTPDGDLLKMLTSLVEAYEEQHYPITPPDPIEAIEFHVERLG
jgi:HTH-type transcriptional regulator / antitoxin HigA